MKIIDRLLKRGREEKPVVEEIGAEVKNDCRVILEIMRNWQGVSSIPIEILVQRFALRTMVQGDLAWGRLKEALKLLGSKSGVGYDENGEIVIYSRSVLWGCNDCIHKSKGSPSVCEVSGIVLSGRTVRNCGSCIPKNLVGVLN